MTEVEAERRTKEALRIARVRAGDSVSAVKAELLRMMRNDAKLSEALTVMGIARLEESQNLHH